MNRKVEYHYPYHYLIDEGVKIKVQMMDLKTLKHLKLVFEFYSDSSASTLGYRFICQRIEDMEKYSKRKRIFMKSNSFIESAINWFKENRMVAKVDRIIKEKPERTLYHTMLMSLSNNIPSIVDSIEEAK